MNDDKAQKMLTILQCGFTAGLQHRYECYVHYEDLITRWGSAMEDIKKDMWEIILEFEKTLAPDTEEYTLEELIKDIESWYKAS